MNSCIPSYFLQLTSGKFSTLCADKLGNAACCICCCFPACCCSRSHACTVLRIRKAPHQYRRHPCNPRSHSQLCFPPPRFRLLPLHLLLFVAVALVIFTVLLSITVIDIVILIALSSSSSSPSKSSMSSKSNSTRSSSSISSPSTFHHTALSRVIVCVGVIRAERDSTTAKPTDESGSGRSGS